MFSRHTWQVFQYELRRNITRRGFLFMTFGVPLIAFVLLIGYQLITEWNKANADPNEEVKPEFDFRGIQQAGYVDLSGQFTQPTGPLGDMLKMYPDEASAQAALTSHEIDVYYVIAPDYLESGEVTLNIPGLSLSQISPAPIVQLVYSQLPSNVDPAILTRLRFPANIQEENPRREGTLNEGSRFGLMYLFSLTFVFGLFMTSGYLMQSVIDEKESRLIEILISTVRPTQLLTGKILALGLLGMSQIIIWLLALVLLGRLAGGIGSTLTFLVELAVPLNILPLVLAYFVLGFLVFAAAYGAVGALSTSMQEGPQFAVIFSLPAALPYYFLGVFMQSPDATLPVIFSLFPLTSPLAMIMRLSIASVPPLEIVISLILLALTAVGAMWLAGRLFRVNTLLAGQVPKLREIPRLLRG